MSELRNDNYINILIIYHDIISIMILNELLFNEGRKVNKRYFEFFCKQNIKAPLILDMYDTELTVKLFD